MITIKGIIKEREDGSKYLEPETPICDTQHEIRCDGENYYIMTEDTEE